MKKYKCLSCGFVWFAEDAAFCPECGGRFVVNAKAERDVPKKSKMVFPTFCGEPVFASFSGGDDVDKVEILANDK